jgi:hypothetical protein
MRKSLFSRLADAIERADEKGVKTLVDVPYRQYRALSVSREGEQHVLRYSASGWSCSCDGFYYTGMCHHIGALARRAEQEQWPGRFVIASERRV